MCVCVRACVRVPHHTDLGLLAGAGGADECVQLDAQLLVLAQHLVEPLHEVLGLARVREVLWKTQRGASEPSRAEPWLHDMNTHRRVRVCVDVCACAYRVDLLEMVISFPNMAVLLASH